MPGIDSQVEAANETKNMTCHVLCSHLRYLFRFSESPFVYENCDYNHRIWSGQTEKCQCCYSTGALHLYPHRSSHSDQQLRKSFSRLDGSHISVWIESGNIDFAADRIIIVPTWCVYVLQMASFIFGIAIVVSVFL